MRLPHRLMTLFWLAVGVIAPAAGQITITSADAASIFAAGKTSYSYQDTLALSVNIGNTGSTSWDFSSLRVGYASTLTSVTASSTPYFTSDFSTATHAFQTSQSQMGVAITVYQYFILGTNLQNPGTKGGGPSPFGDVVYSLKNSPAATEYAFPSTYGTNWNSTYTEAYSITVGGFPIISTTTNYTTSYVVDAYGSMKVPGGATYQALRIRYQERSPDLSVGYVFIAKEGAIITVTAGDTIANSGTIPVLGVSWISPTPVGVAAEQTTPTEYRLLQNFPNPFNPATEIKYLLPEAGRVKLSVYDLLGREVAVLVDEEKTAGEYTARFDAKGLSSGAYLYKLEAGTFAQTRRMLLVR